MVFRQDRKWRVSLPITLGKLRAFRWSCNICSHPCRNGSRSTKARGRWQNRVAIDLWNVMSCGIVVECNFPNSNLLSAKLVDKLIDVHWVRCCKHWWIYVRWCRYAKVVNQFWSRGNQGAASFWNCFPIWKHEDVYWLTKLLGESI